MSDKNYFIKDCIILIFLIYPMVSRTLPQTSSNPHTMFGSLSAENTLNKWGASRSAFSPFKKIPSFLEASIVPTTHKRTPHYKTSNLNLGWSQTREQVYRWLGRGVLLVYHIFHGYSGHASGPETTLGSTLGGENKNFLNTICLGLGALFNLTLNHSRY